MATSVESIGLDVNSRPSQGAMSGYCKALAQVAKLTAENEVGRLTKATQEGVDRGTAGEALKIKVGRLHGGRSGGWLIAGRWHLVLETGCMVC